MSILWLELSMSNVALVSYLIVLWFQLNFFSFHVFFYRWRRFIKTFQEKFEMNLEREKLWCFVWRRFIKTFQDKVCGELRKREVECGLNQCVLDTPATRTGSIIRCERSWMGLFQVILLMCQLLSMSHVIINFSIVYFSRCGAKNNCNFKFCHKCFKCGKWGWKMGSP